MCFRRCSHVRLVAMTKRCRSCEGTASSWLVIESISNPSLECSSASPRVHCYGYHWTKNYSIHVERLLWRSILLYSHRAKMWRTGALPPGAPLPLRGSNVVEAFLLGAALL